MSNSHDIPYNLSEIECQEGKMYASSLVIHDAASYFP